MKYYGIVELSFEWCGIEVELFSFHLNLLIKSRINLLKKLSKCLTNLISSAYAFGDIDKKNKTD